ncbi:lipase [Diplocarpon rosae]|nr:lipase [Diplocarpon rosae]
MNLILFMPALGLLPLILAAPSNHASPPIVAIPFPATIIEGSSDTHVETFNGIPYAKPPVGALRLKPPQALSSPLGRVTATGIPTACPQMSYAKDLSNLIPKLPLRMLLKSSLFQGPGPHGEDCLTLNVQRPVGTTAYAKLPVLFWIFGGGFESGSTARYDGSSLVKESAATGQPIILVAVNYRVGGFGFLPGKEVLADGSTNLGLLDQRLGLQWVADNIAAFGGDPEKVTIWGESAGAISVLDQMALYDGENKYQDKALFRGAILNSGSVVTTAPVDGAKGQAIYDKVVEAAGCSTAQSSLACLRALDYTSFLDAANSVPGKWGYSSVALSYMPRPVSTYIPPSWLSCQQFESTSREVFSAPLSTTDECVKLTIVSPPPHQDGKLLTDSPDALVAAGKYAAVPFIISTQENEGTIFALSQYNMTKGPQLAHYLSTHYFADASKAQVNALLATYPDQGSKGLLHKFLKIKQAYAQFKRRAQILGDITFVLTRRHFLATHAALYPDVPSWSFIASYYHKIPVLGTFHGSDILKIFRGNGHSYVSAATRAYYFSFAYHLDPNIGNEYKEWPQWKEGKQLVQFYADGSHLITDTFRSSSYDWLVENMGSLKV